MRHKLGKPNTGLFGAIAHRRRKRSLKSPLRKTLLAAAALGLLGSSSFADTFVSGYLNYEYYPGKVRDDVESGTAGTPSTAGTVAAADKSGVANRLESGTNFADNYANRFYGFFVPPTTGDYVFFIAGDDDSDLFLSTDSNPANKALIAQEAGWSPVRSYTAIGGGSVVEDKRSDSFSGTQWPNGGTIHLTAGSKYYIEAVHHEGTGGDNLAVTYKLASEADPANGSAPRLVGSVIGFNATNAPAQPNISINLQPIGGTFYDTDLLNLVVGVQSDSPYPVIIQWQRNGTNIAGANSPTYQVGKPTAAANAGTYTVLASVPGPTGSLVTVTSAPVNVTIESIPLAFVSGKLNYEYYPGSTRAAVEGGGVSPSSPGTTVGSDASGLISSFEAGVNFADNYANRITGYFIPPADGNYIFFVSSDDDSDLFLSTDDTPANKKLIARESNWSNNRQWNTPGGGTSTVEDKRSDQFTASEWPTPNVITLKKGQKYYIEGVHAEGGGGDDFGATYKLETEDDSLVANNTASRLTGDVVGTFVPRIMSITGVATGYKTLSFGIADSDPSVLNPSTVKLTVDGTLVSVTGGTKDTNGVTRFSYNHPTPLAQGSTHIYTIQATDTNGKALTRTASFTIPFQLLPKTDLPGPAVVNNNWVSRFIFNHTDANGTVITLDSLNAALALVNASTQADFNGTIVDVITNVVNWGGTAFTLGVNAYPDEVTTANGWTGDNFVNLNVGHIVIPEEGDYTFGMHSDDGMVMRIRGGQSVSVSGGGILDPVDPEVAAFPGTTGDSNTRAVFHLKKGVYRIEYLWYEDGGGDGGEIYAAKGAFVNDADTTNWQLIGGTGPQTLTLLGVDDKGWSVIASDPNTETGVFASWADGDAALAATGGGAKTYDKLDVGDPDTNPGVLAFPKDVVGRDENNYAMQATATLVVPADGTYLLGFDTDDGGRMQVVGQNFIDLVQDGTAQGSVAGDTLTADVPTGDSATAATISLKKGNYQIIVGSWEAGGGSRLRASGALLPATLVPVIQIPALAKGAAGTTFQTIGALQLTNAPTGIDQTGGGDITLTITRSGTGLSISWTNGGTLQSNADLGNAAGWTDVTSTSPASVTPNQAHLFYRVKK